MGTGGSFPGAKVRPGRDTNHSPHLVPRSRMSRSYTSPPSAFMACNGTALALAISLYDGFWLLRWGRENREVGGSTAVNSDTSSGRRVRGNVAVHMMGNTA
jgi:hypothetical protein